MGGKPLLVKTHFTQQGLHLVQLLLDTEQLDQYHQYPCCFVVCIRDRLGRVQAALTTSVSQFPGGNPDTYREFHKKSGEVRGSLKKKHNYM